MWYLIVSIPDLCTLTYLSHVYTDIKLRTMALIRLQGCNKLHTSKIGFLTLLLIFVCQAMNGHPAHKHTVRRRRLRPKCKSLALMDTTAWPLIGNCAINTKLWPICFIKSMNCILFFSNFRPLAFYRVLETIFTAK